MFCPSGLFVHPAFNYRPSWAARVQDSNLRKVSEQFIFWNSKGMKDFFWINANQTKWYCNQPKFSTANKLTASLAINLLPTYAKWNHQEPQRPTDLERLLESPALTRSQDSTKMGALDTWNLTISPGPGKPFWQISDSSKESCLNKRNSTCSPIIYSTSMAPVCSVQTYCSPIITPSNVSTRLREFQNFLILSPGPTHASPIWHQKGSGTPKLKRFIKRRIQGPCLFAQTRIKQKGSNRLWNQRCSDLSDYYQKPLYLCDWRRIRWNH